ncbi:MAG: peptidoglycan DD-metalloendopeptidase family protein [Burkholderiales bacterium]|jgi:lipoprotein NlpD|nr:peptidoglycan DD-metalloendopeptidase family protein [Burkholderiales bacterium]
MNIRHFLLNEIFHCISITVIVLVLASCASKQPAPVEVRQPQADDRMVVINGVAQPRAATGEGAQVTGKAEHIVRQGDTLYSIAMQNDLNPQDIAVWNRINDPSKIAVGQTIRLTPPDSDAQTAIAVTTAPLQTVPPVGASPSATTSPTIASSSGALKTSPKAVKEPYSEQKLAAMSSGVTEQPTSSAQSLAVPTPATTASTLAIDGLNWMWPTQGNIIARFSDNVGMKGIDIAGSFGQPVVACAAGRVVYAGSGLPSYGNLIIVKHNDTYLSVYAHNKEMLIKEGQQVARGQKIAEMGNSGTNQVKLHFEVRQDGKPVDPMKFLPAK